MLQVLLDTTETISFMSELLKLRDNYLYFSGGFHLDHFIFHFFIQQQLKDQKASKDKDQVDIATLIDYVATSTV